ncbi:C40 family peptidase [Bacillus halotolerans]|uniref:NlpC/P60 family protein n=1 Tax=Bacillus halotolerans TaxID=260554 RepID=A0A9Q6A7E0_9BACI|nr:C40 family peptidase [Bacillus halotolerans]MCM3352700.1 C40 family peptidase [Bacillus halotolerans]PLS05912.1 NlpC/P60 family protein [Bacillus halotolerans]QVN28942.1 C40 family peptidase [Bacillus halotolerans]
MNHTVISAVANIWTAPDTPRPFDQTMLDPTVSIREWLNSMTYDQRLGLCTDNVIQTQVLFGEEVLVTAEQDEWVSVVVPGQSSRKDKRGYPGWMKKNQLKNTNLPQSNHTVAISKPTAFLYGDTGDKEIELSFLTALPLIEEENGFFKVATPFGDRLLRQTDAALVQNKKGTAEDIIQTGVRFLGLPYLWGGISGFGFDCSGFMYSVFKANGYRIPRDAGDQAKTGKEVPLHDIGAGDLLFFAYEEGNGAIHHVGLSIGDGKMLHSPKTGKSIEIITLKDTGYEKELCAARRCFSE